MKYIVKKEAWLYGSLYKAGDTVEMNAAQAEYYLGGGVIEAPKPATPAPKRRTKAPDANE